MLREFPHGSNPQCRRDPRRGVGTRIGLDIPKQLLKIAGRTILEHTIAQFDAHPDVDEIIVLMAAGHLDAVRQIVRDGSYEKVVDIVEGAETRSGTTMRALDRLGDGEAHVLLHDAVRPLVTTRIISECFEALKTHRAVDVAIPSADTIVEVRDDDTIREIPPRASLRRGQTPQAFHASVIRRAYEIAAADPDFVATDDCSVVLRYLPEVPIYVVAGDERNMKVTEPIDVYLADKLFQLAGRDAPTQRTDAEYVAALQDRTVVVFGGSYGIGADLAELARSYGAEVFTFSRSATGTDVAKRADIAAAAATVLEKTGRVDFVINTAGVLPVALWWRPRRRPSTQPPRSTTSARSSSPKSSSHIWPRPKAHYCSIPPRPIPGVAPTTACTPPPRQRWST